MFTITSLFDDGTSSKMEHMSHDDLIIVVGTVDNLPGLTMMNIIRETDG